MKDQEDINISITAIPDAPQNLIAITSGSSQITTTWDAVAGATYYNVYRSTTASGPYELVGLTATPSYTDVGLTPNTTYYYRVTAIEGDTEGALSNIAAATTYPAIPIPPAPDNVSAKDISCSEILITWDVSVGAEGYNVYRSESPAGPFQLVGVTAATSFTNTGLSPCTTYYYFVQAYAGDQFGSINEPVSANTPSCDSPEPPCRHCCCPRCGCNPCCCSCRPRHKH